MILMLLVSIPLAGLAWRFQRSRRQAAAVATIRKLGGNVTYDYDFSRDSTGKLLAGNAASWVPGWLRRICGHDFFHTAQGVIAAYGPPTSESDAITFWQAVDGMPRLQLIDAHGEWVEPKAAVAALEHQTDLHYLALRSASVGDDDLQFIGDLQQLYGLDLNGSRMTDQGVRFLTALPDLGIADLRGTRITRRGIEAFRQAHSDCILAHD